MIPDAKAEQYRKVKVMEERGSTPGERASARAIRQKLEERYPGIAHGGGFASSGASTAPDHGPDGAFGFPPWGTPEGKARVVDGIFDWVRGAAEAYREAQSADTFAEDACQVDMKVLKSGTVKITLTLDADIMADLVEDHPELVATFTRSIGNRVNDYLAALLTGEGLDDET